MKDNYVFDRELLEKAKVREVLYIMGVCTCNEEISYCLTRNIGGITEVLLSKSSTDKKSFEWEIKKLCEYFNAVQIRETK